jgi:small-conductance mechanosensitive channel
MGSAGYVIGAILVIAMAVFVVYMVPSSISANVLITNMKNNLLEKEITLDVQWVGFNALHQQLFTVNEYIEYSTNCVSQVGHTEAWVDYNGLRYYAVLATINGASHAITSSIESPIINITITTGNYVTVYTNYGVQLASSLVVASMESNVTIMPGYVNYTLTGPGVSEGGELAVCH